MNLSIIISNRNDTVMLSVTINSVLESLRPFPPKTTEIIIVDNSDSAIYKLLPSVIPMEYVRERRIKIFRQPSPCLFSARELAASKASGKYIACLDSHMISGRDTFVDLFEFAENFSTKSTGFIHAPLKWAHHHERSSVIERDMSVNELGDWHKSKSRTGLITWKGMPWLCNRKWFLDRDKGLGGYGALSDHHISWGGGDMHIGIKPWLLGFQNWGVSTDPCTHIGPFPKIDQGDDTNHVRPGKYRLYGASGEYPHTFGFLVSCYVLGGEAMIERNESTLINRFGRYLDFKKWRSKAIELGQQERTWLLKRQKMSFEQLLETKPWISTT